MENKLKGENFNQQWKTTGLAFRNMHLTGHLSQALHSLRRWYQNLMSVSCLPGISTKLPLVFSASVHDKPLHNINLIFSTNPITLIEETDLRGNWITGIQTSLTQHLRLNKAILIRLHAHAGIVFYESNMGTVCTYWGNRPIHRVPMTDLMEG